MKEILNQLLRLNLEIEGAIRVLAARDNDEAMALLLEKVDAFDSLLSTLRDTEDVQPEPETIKSETKPEEIKSFKPVSEPESANPESESVNPDHTETPVTVADAVSTNDLRVEDVIAMQESRSLSKAFTINDKFRFIRSIFADDRQEFETAIERLSQCQSLSDAYDYLLNERELDLDNDDVKDFLNILAVHFNAM